MRVTTKFKSRSLTWGFGASASPIDQMQPTLHYLKEDLEDAEHFGERDRQKIRAEIEALLDKYLGPAKE